MATQNCLSKSVVNEIFNMSYHKTRMCKNILNNEVCTRKICHFAHNKDELRVKPNLMKTKLCHQVLKKKLCSDPGCTYAHSKDELKVDNYLGFMKTKKCWFYSRGCCSNGERCRFAHIDEENHSSLGIDEMAGTITCDSFNTMDIEMFTAGGKNCLYNSQNFSKNDALNSVSLSNIDINGSNSNDVGCALERHLDEDHLPQINSNPAESRISSEFKFRKDPDPLLLSFDLANDSQTISTDIPNDEDSSPYLFDNSLDAPGYDYESNLTTSLPNLYDERQKNVFYCNDECINHAERILIFLVQIFQRYSSHELGKEEITEIIRNIDTQLLLDFVSFIPSDNNFSKFPTNIL